MADVKISALPASTTPLDGTEVLPIVQGTTTKQVSVANLTAGRPITTSGLVLTGVAFASLPAASTVTNQIYRVTDVGANGSLWQSNGTTWKLVNGSVYLYKFNIPFILPSSGVMGNNGALTGITALLRSSGPCYMYFPANAISSGSAAGWYYSVLSSSTAATVYNNTYTTGQPTTPASPTAFVTTGPGAYVQTTGNIQGPTFILGANTLGQYGSLQYIFRGTNNNSATTKYVGLNFGTQALLNPLAATTSTITSDTVYTNNSGATNNQMTYSATSGTYVSSAKDTTTNLTVYWYLTLTAVTDTVMIDQLTVLMNTV